MQDQPKWWDWELELSPHLMRRMVDRSFSAALADEAGNLTYTYDYNAQGVVQERTLL